MGVHSSFGLRTSLALVDNAEAAALIATVAYLPTPQGCCGLNCEATWALQSCGAE